MRNADLSSAGWRKSTRSGAAQGDCVEVAKVQTSVAVRDSKHPVGPILIFSLSDWRSFMAGTKAGEFDR
ncbi:DUF397 domain-containing protein [Catellatospora citrea]|uniref:DUF397 domain-containing protein n=1 Tax=Catellatospora citrea TaxID=53366 RepID=A0A8J3KHD1_9ACTN|nr:DUF397 domain-containing protein [Catellatospora citrea]RKE06974.1 uncharacterized protein DUF397 [Catellatospora citrea]GIF95124.1 hypothetical protein Cci01nite_02180 [Catellatospora citrea]